jgi:hypothetical protein
MTNMEPAPDPDSLAAEILNAAWLVRHYARPMDRTKKIQAVMKLGLVVRNAFNATDDHAPLLIAIVDGLRPRPEEPPF